MQLPRSTIARGTGHQNGAIWIQSSGDISVYAISDNHAASGDGFLVLPTTSLGTEYHVVGARARKRNSYRSEFVMVGIQDNTTISMYLNGIVETSSGNHYYQKYLTLNRFDVIQFQSKSDLTGSLIESDKPISVISGSRCGFVNSEKIFIKRSCEYMVIHLPPVRHWGREFIVSPLHSAGGETIVRMIASQGQSVITIGAVEYGYNQHLEIFCVKYRQCYSEIKLTGNSPAFLKALKPILVVLYVSNLARECHEDPGSYCQSDGKSGTSLSHVQPMTQYTSEVIFATFDVPDLGMIRDYTLNIVTLCDNSHEMTLNGHNLPSGDVWRADNELAEYCSLRIIIDEFSQRNQSVFHLRSRSPGSKFAAMLVRNRPGSLIVVSADGVNEAVNTKGGDGRHTLTATQSGTEFIFGFINSCNCWTIDGPRVIIISDSAFPKTTVNILALRGQFKRTVVLSAGTSISVDLPAKVIAVDAYDPQPPAAILVTSSNPITLYGMNDAHHGRSDAFWLGRQKHLERSMSRFRHGVILMVLQLKPLVSS
ncbi:uncharacterized protein [Amphiura filiformis]|uniref:uncharacterized protein n=1 Tax=Amphiura filiformis TaxID=82378 RepID=UPI003B20F032